MIRLLWHLAVRGHSVRVNRCISRPLGDGPKGWFYVCECGAKVAR